MGRSLAQLLEFQPGEKVANTLAIKDFGKEEQFLLFATCKGVVKKTPLNAFGNIRNNGIIAISLDEGDELIGVELTRGKDHIVLGTKSGLAIRFDEQDVRSMGRAAGGVTGARFKRENDEVIALIVIPNGDNTAHQLLSATVNGYGKRTPLEEYPVKGRGTRGVINIEASERNGDVVAMKLVGETDEVIFITQAGILMRTRCSEIRETGRGAQGVRLIKVDEGDKLVAMAKVDPEEEKVEEGGEGPAVTTAQDETAGKPPPGPEAEGKIADGHAPDVPPAAGAVGEPVDPEA
jgi:DNA gyrase subunit A